MLDSFVSNHLILKNGNTSLEYAWVELIVDDPIGLLKVVHHSNCYVSEILWWDRVEIGKSSPIGYGGPRDPRKPWDHYFAETYLQKSFDKNTTLESYFEYLEEVRQNYPDRNLFPGFDIKYRAE